MSSERYIHFDSTYRDRNMWPLPGNFEMSVSSSSQTFEGRTAVDPICNSSVICAWTSNYFNVGTGTSRTLSGTVADLNVNIIASLNDQQTFVIKTDANVKAQKLDNYYSGAVIRNTITDEERRILYSKFLGTETPNKDIVQISVFPQFSPLQLGETVRITDPTDLTLSENPLIFVPCGENSENAYVGNILYNETRDAYRTILGYDSVTHLLTIEGPISLWDVPDNFSIRQATPFVFGPITSSTSSTITIVGGSSVNNQYLGDFIRIRATSSSSEKYNYRNLETPIGETRRIIAYNGTTKVATVSPPFSSNLSGLTSPKIEILPFTKDNMNPFVYTGGVVGQDQSVCYELELISLILPNQTLSVGKGSRIAFYPYVWVEISNITAAERSIGRIIYSNNPNSNNMKFFVPVDDVPNPTVSSFISLDGAGMKQTIKFKPNDSLRFSVRLPNGQIFDTVIEEYVSPNAPNPLKQINAVFSMKRV